MIIGLTGGIASGKSTAARHLGELGAHVIDADRLGHQAYAPGSPGHAAVVAAFGEGIVAEDGSIDRKALGARVFGKPEELARLTGIVWPEIRRLAEADIAASLAADPARVVVLEAAVLFEAGWEDVADQIWVVVAERDTAIRRAVERDGIDAEAVEKRLAAQLSNDERMRRADVVFHNDADLDTLRTALVEHFEPLAAAARAG